MVDVTQFTFSWADVAEALVKKQNLHEGRWMITTEFTISVGNMGVAPPTALPGLVAVANGLQLTAAKDDAPANLVVDAALANPKP